MIKYFSTLLTTKMKLLRIACLIAATELLFLVSIETAPLSMTTQLSSHASAEINMMRRSAAEEVQPLIQQCYEHDFAISMFNLRNSHDWKCNDTAINCGFASEHHCTGSFAKMICPSEIIDIGGGCEMCFNIHIGKNGKGEGAELAMYKGTETVTGVRYHVYVISQKLPDKIYDSVGSSIINSNCSGWQTIQINDDIAKHLSQGDTNLTMVLFVFKEEKNLITDMQCDEIKKVFYLDSGSNFNFGSKMNDSSARKDMTSTTTPPASEPTVSTDSESPNKKDIKGTGTAQTEQPTTTDNSVTDSQPETTMPTSRKVEEVTTEPVLTNQTKEEKMSFNPSNFLPLLTVFVRGEEGFFKLPTQFP